MKRKLIALLILVVMAVVVAGCGGGKSATEGSSGKNAKKVIKLGHILNDKSSFHKWAEKFKEVVERDSKGRIEVRVYPSSLLGDNVKLLTQLRAGTVEATIMASQTLAGVDKKWMLFDMPYLFPNEEVAFKVFDGSIGQKLFKDLEQSGLIGLGYGEYGYRQITNSKREIHSLADAKGMKIRLQENPVHLAAFKAMGMSPTPAPFSEVFTGLQQGAIDGQENPLTVINDEKYYDVQKYLTLSNHVYSVSVMLFSQKAFDKFSPEEQKIIFNAAKESVEYERKANKEMMSAALTALKKKGMVVTELTPEKLAEFKDAAKGIMQQFENAIGQDLIQETMAEIAKYAK